MKIRPIVDIVAFLFIVLFVYAAASKLLELDKFRIQIGQSPMLANRSRAVSYMVPGMELLIALLLAFDKTRMYGLYASFSLMVMFTTYIILILNFSRYVPCSCGGILENMTWTEHLIFNVIFIALAGVGVFLETAESHKPSASN